MLVISSHSDYSTFDSKELLKVCIQFYDSRHNHFQKQCGKNVGDQYERGGKGLLVKMLKIHLKIPNKFFQGKNIILTKYQTPLTQEQGLYSQTIVLI